MLQDPRVTYVQCKRKYVAVEIEYLRRLGLTNANIFDTLKNVDSRLIHAHSRKIKQKTKKAKFHKHFLINQIIKIIIERKNQVICWICPCDTQPENVTIFSIVI